MSDGTLLQFLQQSDSLLLGGYDSINLTAFLVKVIDYVLLLFW